MGTDQQPHHQPLNRRGFLQTSAAFALMAGLGARPNLFAASGLAPKRSIADLHFADFDVLVGESFRVYHIASGADSGADFRSVLCRAAFNLRPSKIGPMPPIEPPPPATSGSPLPSAVLKASRCPKAPIPLPTPRLGHFDLFVVPTMAVAHEERPIAIVNRI